MWTRLFLYEEMIAGSVHPRRNVKFPRGSPGALSAGANPTPAYIKYSQYLRHGNACFQAQDSYNKTNVLPFSYCKKRNYPAALSVADFVPFGFTPALRFT